MHTKEDLIGNGELLAAVEAELREVEKLIAQHVDAKENPPKATWDRYEDAVASKVRLIQHYRRIVGDVYPEIG